ncbi:Wzz/FepE/Etk N-terminal domain-containing protein [Candidatus Zixiibacteriota bacterium]
MNEPQDTSLNKSTSITPSTQEVGDEISLIEIINTVLKNRRLVIVTPLIIFILVVGYTFLQSHTYSTSTSFLPQSSLSQGGLTSSLAAQFGMSLPTSEAGQSPQFYVDLITSREILKDLTDNTYEYRDNGVLVQTSLPKLYKIDENTIGLTQEMTIRVLEELISVTTDVETGLVTCTVQTKWPNVSMKIAQDILDLVNQFNLETRQTQAAAERVFIEERLIDISSELRASEDTLQNFLQMNRQWETSPELEFIHDRLSRKVIMRQQIFTTLSQAHEQARIDEIRDTPVITIVEHPESPVLPDKRQLRLRAILALMVGGMLGIFGAFGREFMIRGHQHEADHFAEYERLKRDTLQDMKNPLRLLKK